VPDAGATVSRGRGLAGLKVLRGDRMPGKSARERAPRAAIHRASRGTSDPNANGSETRPAQGRIDYDSGEKVYLQIARIIRDRIISGELPVGAQIPSGSQMREEWGVNRLTGAQAVEELRRAGLVVTRPGVGTFVAATPKLQVVTLKPGDKVISRMPTEEERERLRTGYVTPVLIVTRADGNVEPYNAAVTVCQVQGLAASDLARNRVLTERWRRARAAGRHA
jgi:DNA-binding transcriptional regulator YhcF (GntR family)